MNKLLFIIVGIFISTLTFSQINFGNGSFGSATISSSQIVNSYKKIQSVSGSNFTLVNTTSFPLSNGNVVLVINMFSGEYELRQVTGIAGNIITLSTGSIPNSSFSSNSQMITVRQYSDMTINAGGEITCPTWDGETGGVVCFLVQNTLTLNSGEIDVEGKGFFGGTGGNGGSGGNGGLGGFSGANSTNTGGQTGSGGSPINGAGWGGGDGFAGTNGASGTLAYFNSSPSLLPCGNTIASCNNSPNPSGRLYLGDGGAGGNGGNGKAGAGGGGSNCNQPGIDGGSGGSGGIGGNGGRGGGIIYIKAGNVVHGSTVIKAMGTSGTAGTAGTAGGNGGAGICGGGGGDGADGGNGGGGGHGGAGGAVKISKSGGSIIPSLVNVYGGGSTNGGTGGAGGLGGANSWDQCACGSVCPLISCAFPTLIPFLSNPNTTVSVDGAGQTHFIFIYGDSLLDLVYSELTFCNGNYIGSLSGTLFEAGVPINQYIAPIASLADNILASLIDFVTNDPANLDGSQQSIHTMNYQLIEGCSACSNCSPRILADNGDPGDSGPGGSGGGTGWYEDECLAPIISPSFQSIPICPGQCITIPISISDPFANVMALSSNGTTQVTINGSTITICNFAGCMINDQISIVASNQCGQSNIAVIYIQSQPGWLNVYPFSQDICSGSSATINVNSQGGCGFNSNSINYNFTLPLGVTTDIPTFGNIMPWMPFTPIFYSSAASTQIVTINFFDYCGGMVSTSEVIVHPSPTANAGPDQVVCSNSPISLTGIISGSVTSATWTSSGNGTFTNATSLNTIYTPGSADINAGQVILTLTTNDPTGPCTTASDQMVVTIGSSATVNAGVDQAICSNSTISLNGTIGGSATSATWTSSGTGTFANANSLTTSYTPSSADINSGSVILTLTTNDPVGPCSSTNDQLVLTFGSTPTVDAGQDQTACSNAPIDLSGVSNGSSFVWSSSGTGSFSNISNLTTSYNPSIEDINSGSIILTLTASDAANVCPSAIDQVVVNLIYTPQNPQISISNNIVSTSMYPNTSYQWVRCPGYIPISGSTNSSFNASSYSGGLAVIVTNECGSDTSDCMNVNLSNLEDLTDEFLEIYPNPTRNNSTIEISENLIGKVFILQDFTGRIILSSKFTSIKTELFLNSMANGCYYLTVEDVSIMRKIIKN